MKRGSGAAGSTSAAPHVTFLLASLEVGGLEWMVVRLARAVRESCAVTVVCYDDGGDLGADLDAAAVPVHVLRRRPGVDATYPFRLARLLKRLHTDVLHAHNDTALFYGGLAAFLGRMALVYTEHDRVFPGRPAVRAINFALAASAHRVVTVSEDLRRLLLVHEGIGGDRVVVVPNGVARVEEDRDGGERLRRRWEVPPGGVVAGVVAGLKPVKNHALLLEAASALAPRYPGLRLVFAGDGPLRADIEARARRLGVADRLRILGFRSDLHEVYAALDVVVLPSDSEGMPLAVIEAMAAARPVVATRVGGVPEVVEEGTTGLLVPPGDAGALERALAGLLDDPERRTAMGGAGRRRFEARYTLRRMAGAYLDIYRDIHRQATGAAPCAG